MAGMRYVLYHSCGSSVCDWLWQKG